MEQSNLTALDLFSGAGGLSTGFEKAGIEVIFASDMEQNSSETYQRNHPDTTFIQRDIHDLEVNEVKDEIANQYDASVYDDLDLVIGGPPCEGFSTQGDFDPDDPRNRLFEQFLRFVEGFEPRAIVMENVKGLLSMEEGDAKRRILRSIKDLGYDIREPWLLNAADFGVPQVRERVFFVASKNGDTIQKPTPTHTGRDQSRLDVFQDGGQQQEMKQVLGAREGISDLPKLENGEKKTVYEDPPQNEYQRELRASVGENELTHHKCPPHRENTRNRFKHIPQGGNAGDIPEEYAEYKPDSYYYARHRKLDPDDPSYTVTSHVVDELLHYDPEQPRVLTVREAARLQSFPDDYTFAGRRVIPHVDEEESQYEQVGNSVPPKLAYQIAQCIKESLAK